MGKLKHYMRSVRHRLSPPRSISSNSSSLSSTIVSRSLSTDTTIDGGSSTTSITSAISYSQIPTPFPAPTLYRLPMTETMSPAPVVLSPMARNADDQGTFLDSHAVLEVNIALLNFAKKLPLEDLRTIGNGTAFCPSSNYVHPPDGRKERASDDIATAPSLRSDTLSFANTISDSSSSCARNTLQRVGQDQTQRQWADAETMVEDEARTLSLASIGSDWTWSFAGFSGWHFEAKSQCCGGEFVRGDLSSNQYRATHEALSRIPGAQQNLATSRSLVGTRDGSSLLTIHSERAPSFTLRSADSCDLFLNSIGLPIPNESFHDDDFDELPDWSDVENDSEYNYFEKRKSFQWSNTASMTSSSPSRSYIPKKRISGAAKDAIFELMSDEDFEALPDWPDVEDDPEYNEFEEDGFQWFSTNSSCLPNPSTQELPMAFLSLPRVPVAMLPKWVMTRASWMTRTRKTSKL